MLRLTLLSSWSLLVLSGCSSTSSAPIDAGHDAPSLKPEDTGAIDAAYDTGRSHASTVDAGIDAAAHDECVTTGTGVGLVGVTADNFFIVSTPTAMCAVPAAGGAPVKIASLVNDGGANAWSASVVNKLVAVWTNTTTDMSTGLTIGTLSVWSSAIGATTKLAEASFADTITGNAATLSVSADGSTVAFVDNAAGTTGALEAVVLSQPTMLHPLAPSIQVGTELTCRLDVTFAGASVVASFCPETMGSAGIYQVNSYETSSWNAVTLLSGAVNAYSVDGSGTHVLAETSGDQLDLFPIDSATGTLVSATDTLAPTQYPIGTYNGSPSGLLFTLTPDGTTILYATAAGMLRTSPVSPVAPTTLASSVSTLDGISPDGHWVLVNDTTDDAYGYPLPGDLSLVSLTGGSTTTLVAATASSSPILPAGFTGDSSYVTYLTSGSVNKDGDFTATLNAMPVQGASSAIVATTSAFLTQPLSGSKYLYGDSLIAGEGFEGFGTVNLHVQDFATSTGAQTVATGADSSAFATADGTTMAYTLNQGTPKDGLYVVPVP